jgi:hypothetical protein
MEKQLSQTVSALRPFLMPLAYDRGKQIGITAGIAALILNNHDQSMTNLKLTEDNSSDIEYLLLERTPGWDKKGWERLQ